MLQSMPLEVIETIFLLCDNPNLHRVNRCLFQISRSDRFKALWLVYRHGENAVSRCWKWRFMRQTCQKKTKCLCKTTQSNECGLEERQLSIISDLVLLNCNVNADECHALQMAAKFGHLQLVEYLLMNGSDRNPRLKAKSWVRKLQSPFRSATKDSLDDLAVDHPSKMIQRKRGYFLLRAVQKNQKALIRVLLKDFNRLPSVEQEPTRIIRSAEEDGTSVALERPAIPSKETQHAFELAIQLNRVEIAQSLLDLAQASASSLCVKNLLIKANLSRMLFGIRNKYAEIMRISLSSMSDTDFDRMAPYCMRQCSEIGSVEAVRVCVERGGDVNAWDGVPLYSSVYCGSTEVTKYLLDQPHTSLEYFGTRQAMFCISMLFVEGFAMLLFGTLVVLWILGFVSSGIEETVGATQDLSGLAIPTLIAMTIMYRLVPFHRVTRSLVLIWNAKRARQRDQLVSEV